jgi:hypothetical protein
MITEKICYASTSSSIIRENPTIIDGTAGRRFVGRNKQSAEGAETSIAYEGEPWPQRAID